MQELLVLIVIALAIFYLPKMMGRRAVPEPAPAAGRRRRPPLTGRMRLAILIQLFWVAGSAAILKPWQNDPLPFLSLGIAPAAAAWGAVWVWFGYKRFRR